MHAASFDLVAVAFLRSTGGRVRVLFAIDRDGEQLFEGEPALLVEHRPGADAAALLVEVADRIRPEAIELVVAGTAAQLAQVIDAAHDEYGQLVGDRLLGTGASFTAPFGTFDGDS